MLHLLLMVRDLAFSGTDVQTIKAIFGLAGLFGVLNGFGSTPAGTYGFLLTSGRADPLAESADLGTSQLMFFGIALFTYPLIGSFGDDVVSQLVCYAVSACLGASFGAIHRTFLECLPRVIQPGADTLQILFFFDMCKRLGTGLGLFMVGMFVPFCAMGPGEIVVPKSDGGHSAELWGPHHTRGEYFTMCCFCAMFAMVSSVCMLSLPVVVSQERRALQACDQCFETTSGLHTA